MDLSTVKKKLEAGEYSYSDQLADDVRLIWSNARQYNGDDDHVTKVGETLSAKFEELYRFAVFGDLLPMFGWVRLGESVLGSGLAVS